MTPKLSILLPAMLGYESIRAAIDAWEAQSCSERLEILILCPKHLGPAKDAQLSPRQVMVPLNGQDLHEARALGIQRASGQYTMLAEDHCLPDPGWAQAILDCVEEGWDAVGPALRPGNRSGCWPEGSFLIGYGEWMMPIEGGPTQILCGWNGTIRTRLLQEIGPELSGELLIGAFLIRRLQSQGSRFYLEGSARMRHFDPPGCAREIFLVALVGLGFGAKRTRQWSRLATFLYPLGFPAIAFLHAKRAFIHYRRAGAEAGLGLTTLLASFVLAIAWAAGEAAGAWMGIDRVGPYLWRTEVKPVQPEDVHRSNVAELAPVKQRAARA